MEKPIHHTLPSVNLCYCGKEKKSISKTCITCSKQLTLLRSKTSNAKATQDSRDKAKIELDKMLELMNKKSIK